MTCVLTLQLGGRGDRGNGQVRVCHKVKRPLTWGRWGSDDQIGTLNNVSPSNAVAKAQGVEIRKGDFVIIRTGQMERCMSRWGGYAGGEASGVLFENCYWCRERDIAALCADTWGVGVRPNEGDEVNQPWHWVVIPALGLTMGEVFYVAELAADCAMDGVYEFLFVAPPLVIMGGTGSPINPMAIK